MVGSRDSTPDSSCNGSSVSDAESEDHPTPITAPQTPRTPRPSDLKTIQCPYESCSKTFNRQARLVDHLRSHTNERPFKCPAEGCTKDFLRDSHLKHHTKSAHSTLRDYICDWQGCNKKFATGTRLRRHQAAHRDKEKYRCRGYEGCNETFRKHATLNRHVMSVHQKTKPFPCQKHDPTTGGECDQAFDTAEKLRAHQRRKHDEGRFVCTECPQSIFEAEYQTLAEQLTGDDIDPNVFQPPSFTTYALLQVHIAAVHPPACPQCPTVCTSQRELRRHIESLHGISPLSTTATTSDPASKLQCPHCHHQFLKKGNLNVHIKTVHDGTQYFVCGATDLSTSKNIPHDVPAYIGCGRSFTAKGSLEEHVRTVHLGLLSVRAERKRARQSEQPDDAGSELKRKRRATKPKMSALEAITGVLDSAFATPDAHATGRHPYYPSPVYRPADDILGNDEMWRFGVPFAQAEYVSGDGLAIDPSLL